MRKCLPMGLRNQRADGVNRLCVAELARNGGQIREFGYPTFITSGQREGLTRQVIPKQSRGVANRRIPRGRD